ncbi:PAS domain S-box protein [bacterium]|nr:PAS domain S-box protein [bacterium]
MDRKIKILIVEDEKIIAADISQNLKGLGYEVVKLVSSGEDAVESCRKLKPDVVLMDIKLKGKMDGIEAADEIRKKYGTPVVYVTSYTDEETLERVKQTEPYGFIVKPIMEEELRGVIETTVYKYRMEQSLKEMEAWQSTTLQSIGDAVITLDNRGNVTFINRIAENLTGWRVDEAKGKPVSDIFPIFDEQTGKPIPNPVKRILKNRKVSKLGSHTILISRNGERIPISDSAAPIVNDKKEILGVVLVFHDETERRRAEERLRESEDRYRSSIQAAPYGVVLHNKKGEFILYNEKAENISGYTADEVKSIEEWFKKSYPDEEYRNKVANIFREDMSKGVSSARQAEITRKDGEKRTCMFVSSFISQEERIVFISDVTEKVKADQELKVSEEWHKALKEGSRDAIFIADSESKFIDVNNAAVVLTGYSREDFLKMTIPDLHEEEDLEAYRKYFHRIISGESLVSEAKLLRKDGTKIDVEFSNKPIIINGITYIHASARDVTERKIAERELRESEEKYSTLFNDSRDAIFIHELNGRIMDINNAVKELFGYSKEELFKLGVGVLHPEYEAKKVKAVFSTLRKKGHADFTIDMKKKNGEIFPADNSATIMEIGGKKVVQGIIRDVTEKKKNEAALRESEERYRTLFNFGADAIFVHPYKKKGFGKFIEVNKVACERLGYTREELLNLSPADISKKADVKKRGASEERGRILRNGTRAFEAVHITKDGREIPVEIISTVFQYGGEKVLMSVARDISEWKK